MTITTATHINFELRWDEKLLIDLEGPYSYRVLAPVLEILCFEYWPVAHQKLTFQGRRKKQQHFIDQV